MADAELSAVEVRLQAELYRPLTAVDRASTATAHPERHAVATPPLPMNRSSRALLAAAGAGLAATCGGVALSGTYRASAIGTAAAPRVTPPLSQAPERYSASLKQICGGAVLFKGTHTIGTRAGAIAVARDIRTSGSERLGRADAVPKPRGTRRLAERWIATQRRLTGMYASNYLRIWYAIERAHTPTQRAQLPTTLRALIDEPRQLERQASELEAALNVPDCTGGSTHKQAGTGEPQA